MAEPAYRSPKRMLLSRFWLAEEMAPPGSLGGYDLLSPSNERALSRFHDELGPLPVPGQQCFATAPWGYVYGAACY